MHGLQACLLLHAVFMLSVVKMVLKGEVGGHALNSHENYIVDHGKSWKNHGIVFLNFCGNSASECQTVWIQNRPNFCSGFKLFAELMNQQQKSPLESNELRNHNIFFLQQIMCIHCPQS